MNVEHKSTRAAQTGAMEGRFGKPKAAGAGGAAADAGGFMSVLMSLGAADGTEDVLAVANAGEMADDGKMTSALDLAQLQPQGADVAQTLQSRPGGVSAAAGQMGAVSVTQALAQNGLTKPAPEGLAAGAFPVRKTAAAGGDKAAAALSARSGQEPPLGRPDLGGVPGPHGARVTEVASAAATGTLSELMAASAPSGESIRQAMRQADRNNGPAVGAAGEGGWGASAFQVGGQMDVQAASASATAALPEAAIAQQVHYWISNDVQNAELKLDNWGQSPVEVSISLQGNEARVEFRTDVPELREILEGASAQLKDMLQGEGLVLSGVSVGSSGAGGAGAREQSPRPDMRRATVALPETAAVVQPRRAGSTTGQSVDVFV